MIQSFRKINPEQIMAEKITEENFKNFKFICKHPDDADTMCAFRDQMYCSKENLNDCQFCSKKCEINIYTPYGYSLRYCDIGDYVIYDEHFAIKNVLTEDELKKEYIEVK